MRLGPFEITRHKAQDLVTYVPSSRAGWWPIVREGFAGAWQRSVITPVQDALTHPTFWACVTLIAGDIAKMRVTLVSEDSDGISSETTNPAYSPVLAKPNHYQNRIQFYFYWIVSKLTRGNAYALKERDGRGVVTALYLLDPVHVRPMISPAGDVYYSVAQDLLAGIDSASVVVPAREIIHDTMCALYHPLVGLSPVYACGHAAIQGLTIINNSTTFFQQGSQVGGVLTAPGQISTDTAKRLEEYWEANYAGPKNIGKIAVLGDGLTFQKSQAMSAVDAELIDQLKWGDEKICSTVHVPPYMVGVGQAPNYNNIEALNQQYYSQGLQILIESLELCLAEGLELKAPYDIEFDLESLLRMDSVQKMEAATKGVLGGVFSPNEARARFNLQPVKGGQTPYLQQQNYSLAALDARDAAGAAPHPTATPPKPETPATVPAKALDDLDAEVIDVVSAGLLRKALAA